MGKKKDKKKVNAKKEKYSKFKKDPPKQLNFTMPELSPEQVKLRQEDESRFERFLRFNRNRPALDLREKKAKKK